jgi:SAM-dependent methyltransferase
MTLVGQPSNIEFITAPSRPTQMPVEWYDANSEDHFWFQWRTRVTRMLVEKAGIPTEQNLRVLDIGCGTGIVSKQLALHTRWTFDGVDLNYDALNRCDLSYRRVLYYDILEKHRDFADAYDVAILFDTLEHIEHTHAFLEAVFYHVRPGGVLLVNVPALMSLYGVYDRATGHWRRYTQEALAREFKSFDVDLVLQRYWGFSLVPFLWLRQQWLRSGMSDQQVIQTGFVPPNPLIHALLKSLMKIETRLLKRPPVGSSVMGAIRKRKHGA